MSSKPSRNTVGDVRYAMTEYKRMLSRVTDMRLVAKELPDAEVELAAKHREIITLLDGMDIVSRGNMGWENRFVWFLTEWDKQVREENV